MRFTEFLLEGLSDKLFHYTKLNVAANILQTKSFKLASTVGDHDENKIGDTAKYPYFMSATRTLTGSYHNQSKVTDDVIFNLDGRWLGQRYKGAPIDFFQDKADTTAHHGFEAEDRIFSKTPDISIKCVKSVHILVDTANTDMSSVKQIVQSCKSNAIPYFVYTSKKAWVLQDKRNIVQDLNSLESSKVSKPKYDIPKLKQLVPWLELIQVENEDGFGVLEPDVKKLALKIANTDLDKITDQLTSIMRQNSKPDNDEYESATKVIKYMKTKGLNSIRDLVDDIVEKWEL